ncbi:MAG TPA: bleomycin resistance protein [Trueperaceae bacterium]
MSSTSRDRVTANLPSRDFDATEDFYRQLGFDTLFKDDGWMILRRGALELEFFPYPVEPRRSAFSACIRVDDLDALFEAFAVEGLPRDHTSIPRISAPAVQHGLRMFALVDPEGSLLRCIQNPER